MHNIKRLLERKCLSLPKNIKSQNKSVAMENLKSHLLVIDVFDKLLLNDKLNPNLPIDDLHLNGAGYRILVYTLRVFYVSRDE